MKSQFSLIAGFLLIVLATQARAGHFSSASGFSFDYPDGWVVATKEQRQAVRERYKAVFEKMGDVDLGKMAVLVFNPENDGFAENVNVVVSAGRMPVNEDSRRKLEQAFSEQLGRAGLTPIDLRSEIVTFGRRKAISTRWIMAGLVPGVVLRQWQVAIPGRNQTYAVTASASTTTFPQYEPRFRSIFASFKADAGALGFWHGLPGIVQSAIIGGITAGIAAAIGVRLRPVFRRKAGMSGDNKAS